jgi:hypothetical protein
VLADVLGVADLGVLASFLRPLHVQDAAATGILEESHRIYRMLRLKTTMYPNARLEGSGIPGMDQGLCQGEPSSTQRLENTNKHELRFRALLTEGGAQVDATLKN